ncbi:MAG: TolC family protein [FCB group bacterium]|jgi:outer membrane protein TolC|nr:TolC family protein [FCB group bacterium]
MVRIRTVNTIRIFAFAALIGLVALSLGCAPSRFRKAADRETYGVIAEKTPEVPGMDTQFTIEEGQDAAQLIEDLAPVEVQEDFLGEEAIAKGPVRVIGLEKALELAVKENRDYQRQKEVVYLSALQLTLERHQWTPIFNASGSAAYARTTRDITTLSTTAELAQAAPTVITQLGQLTGTPGELLNRYAQLVESAATVTGANQPSTDTLDERSVVGDTRVGMSLLLAGGAQIAIDLSSNFLRFLTNDPRVGAQSALAATLRKPLLRGAGRKVAQENLTQAERDVLYDLREFARFRKDFAVRIAESYFRVLQARDAAQNNYLGYLALQQDAIRMEAMAREGRNTETDLGLSRQAELNAKDDWILSVQRYKQSLDEFKIQLGLMTDAAVVLDPAELDRLMAEGLKHPSLTDEEAVEVALVTRLDLYNVRDQEDDAARKVYVAANALKPGLDLVIQGAADSVGDDRFQELDFKRARISAGLDLDPDLDKKSERNQYRATLINHERSQRERELAEDNVKLQVREDWRTLEQAKRSFEIRQTGVALNERRVAEQTLLGELGRATARDTVEAQNDLIGARNALTDALVSHTIARLQFWRDMGILYIKDNGQWEEVTDVDNPDTGSEPGSPAADAAQEPVEAN